ncbi:general transcription factor II-I repeat domain-containing protein 2A-like [Tachysurus ichikawai]
MKPVMEIVNYIRTHALNHRQFKNLIAELDQDLPGDLLLHCTVRWLSKGQVLSGTGTLTDLEWIMDLALDLTHAVSLGQTEPDLAGGQVTSTTLNKQRARYATLVENLHGSFVVRFRDLQVKRPQITFLVDPFNAETDCLKAPLVTDEAGAELEMIDLLATTEYKPDLKRIVQGKECQKSH